jgi:hypothetical protein
LQNVRTSNHLSIQFFATKVAHLVHRLEKHHPSLITQT